MEDIFSFLNIEDQSIKDKINDRRTRRGMMVYHVKNNQLLEEWIARIKNMGLSPILESYQTDPVIIDCFSKSIKYIYKNQESFRTNKNIFFFLLKDSNKNEILSDSFKYAYCANSKKIFMDTGKMLSMDFDDMTFVKTKFGNARNFKHETELELITDICKNNIYCIFFNNSKILTDKERRILCFIVKNFLACLSNLFVVFDSDSKDVQDFIASMIERFTLKRICKQTLY